MLTERVRLEGVSQHTVSITKEPIFHSREAQRIPRKVAKQVLHENKSL